MASDTVLAGVRKSVSELKRAQSIKLKEKLVEYESEYRRRFRNFVDTFKNVAEQSECLTHTRIKTILKAMDEVLKGSDELLVGFERKGYQLADALYERITAHRRRWADSLYTYCAQLQDICNLLKETSAPDEDKTSGSVLHDSLLPIHHVQVLLDIFQVVKKDLVDNRRLVEVFGCNTLIEQLNKELGRMSKVMKSINAEGLLCELQEMASNYNSTDNSIELALPTTDMETRLNSLKIPAASLDHKENDPVRESLSAKENDQADQLTKAQSEFSITESFPIEGYGEIKNKITRSSNIPLSPRESKKRRKYQVQSFASKLSEMKKDLFLLEQKLKELQMHCTDSSSDDENESITEDCEVKTSISCNDTEEGVKITRTTPFARIKDNQTKALLRSSMRRAPLYQKYQKLEDHDTERSPITKPFEDDMSMTTKDEINDTRPESGIELEEGLYNDSDENIFRDASELNGHTGDTNYYLNMNGADFKSKTINSGDDNNSNRTVRLRTQSLQVSNSKYESTVYSNYENMEVTSIDDDQPVSSHLPIQDDNGTDQNQKMPDDEKLLNEPPMTITPKFAKQRIGWCQIPLVKESGVLEKMTSKQRTLQEAKYEMISSKVSYLKSLSIVQSVFIANEELRKLITPTEWNNLFQFIGPIKQCSEHFLSDLLSGWPQDIFLSNQLSVVRQYAESGLEVYVDFCSHKITMDDTLKNIRACNPRANKILKQLEQEEICDGHDLESFLVLPVQRITRFPLLVEGILWRMDSNNDKDFCDWAKTYHKLRTVTKRCNDAVKDAETKKLSMNFLKSSSSTLPAKKNKMSTLWNEQD